MAGRTWVILAVAVALAAVPSMAASTATVDLVLELDAPPPVTAYIASRASGGASAASADAVLAQRLRVDAQQDAARSALTALFPTSRVLFRLDRLFNGLAVQVPAADVARLATVPGVKGVHPLVRYRPTTSTSVPFIGATWLWRTAGLAITGQGVSIGIIDTGIDYLHEDFGGNAQYAGQTFDDASVPWTAKVVGGTDLVGDDYDGTNTAKPDGDPMDCNGHGTHVAGIAAGYGVDASGHTYGGPWTDALQPGDFIVGPGVAPGAELYAIKVFGCDGSTAYSSKGLDWAIDPNGDGDYSDHLDVANLSLGSSYGAPDYVLESMVDRAAQAGMIVVAAAGNDGGSHFIVSTPSTADRAISVANSVDAASVVGDVTVTAPASAAGSYLAGEADAPPAPPRSVSGQLRYPTSGTDGCAGYPAGAFAGVVALIDRGTCTFVEKVKNAQDAGAIAAVIANNQATGVIGMSGSDASISIPSLFISQADGQQLRGDVQGSTVTVRLGTRRELDPTQVDTLASSSSRGPRGSDYALKPDLAAPGTTIRSARARSGWGGTTMSGTSMATPEVSGGMALLRQLHPTWPVVELKALVMNTAVHDLSRDGNDQSPYWAPARAGAGRIDLTAAASSDVVLLADDDTGRVGVSFGRIEAAAPVTVERSVRVVNEGPSTAVLGVAYRPSSTVAGVTITASPSTVVVDPLGTATVTLRLHADPGSMRHDIDPAESPLQMGSPRFWLTEASGLLVLSPSDGEPLRLPVYAAPRPAATMAAAEASLALPGAKTTTALHLSGRDLSSTVAPPFGVRSLVVPLELQSSLSGTVKTGVASDYAARVAAGQSVADAVIAFGIAIPAFSSPNTADARVLIGTTGLGTSDFTLSLTNLAEIASSDSDNDTFVTQLCPQANGSTCSLQLPLSYFPADEADTEVFGSDVLVLFVRMADLGLGGSQTSFRYRVTTSQGGTSTATWDPAHPGISFGAGTAGPGIFLDAAGATIPLTIDPSNISPTTTRGIMLLHLHDRTGARAQTIPVTSTACTLSCTATAPLAAVPGESVPFASTVTSSGCASSPTTAWDFGDGGSSTAANPVHTYVAAGTFDWKLTVTAGMTTCVRSGATGVASASNERIRHRVGR